MNELILLLSAFFVLTIGMQLMGSVIDFGFAVADKVLQNSGKIVRAPFKVLFKLTGIVFKFVFRKLRQRNDYYTVKPFQMSPLEIHQLRKHNLNKKIGNSPVEIEYTRLPKNLTKGI